jgi:hypothetical protein
MSDDASSFLPPFVLIYAFAACDMRDGSNTFLERLFQQLQTHHRQIYWIGRPVRQPGLVFPQDFLRWPWRTGRGFLRRWLERAGLLWWNHNQFNEHRLHREIHAGGFSPRFAYVVVLDESQAAFARQMLQALRLPYLLHCMDLFHPDGLDPARTPEFCALAAGAAQIIAISPRVAEELGKYSAAPTLVTPCGSFLPPASSRPWSPPFTVTISGSVYDSAAPGSGTPLHWLEEILPQIRNNLPVPLRFVYFGGQFHRLPASLQAVFENAGYVEDIAPYCQSTHLAILPLPYWRESPYRFSLPSRMSDFLVSGTPVACACEPETIMHDFILQHPDQGAYQVSSSADLLALITRLAGDPVAWAIASAAALRLGRRELSITGVQEKIRQIMARFDSPAGGNN